MDGVLHTSGVDDNGPPELTLSRRRRRWPLPVGGATFSSLGGRFLDFVVDCDLPSEVTVDLPSELCVVGVALPSGVLCLSR